MLIKLALKNLLGVGFRTWLNVFVISLSYVAIIGMEGFYEGWRQRAMNETIEWEIAGGQYWQKDYDKFDPLTLYDSYDTIPEFTEKDKDFCPILIQTASIYPEGRMFNIMLKGIPENQRVLKIPVDKLEGSEENAVIIGKRMARTTGLKKGDYVTLRWRDANGTFDAQDIVISEVFTSPHPGVDSGQLWMELKQMQKLFGMTDKATIICTSSENNKQIDGWVFHSQDYLLNDLKTIFKIESIQATVMYAVLLFLVTIAIFDTQILSIFRRRKEIGTLMALGLTKSKVVTLFTLEGVMHGAMAIFMGAVYGVPLFILTASKGWSMPDSMDDYGLAGSSGIIYPVYNLKVVLTTVIYIMLIIGIVSLIPTTSIIKMNPAEAIQGKRRKK